MDNKTKDTSDITKGEREYPVMVSIRCATYNHVNYIRKCLEGFVMQQTNFPFEAIVHDDASTDGTTEIVREFAEKYPVIIKPFYEKENVWSRQDGSLTKLFKDNLRGKYMASCDGDDYWTDPLKLQKQVDFLESHPDYSMVHTGFDYINKDGEIIPVPDAPLYKTLTDRIRNGYIWDYLLVHSSFILYSTLVCRIKVFKKENMGIDHGVFMSCARQGKVQYLPDSTTAYRILDNSFMRTNQTRVVKYISDAIFKQLNYYCACGYKTLPHYRYNIKARIAVAEGILSSMAHYSCIKGERKFRKMLFVLFSRPLNTLLLPVALCMKLKRKFVEKG